VVDGYIEKGHSIVVVDILEASRLNNINFDILVII